MLNEQEEAARIAAQTFTPGLPLAFQHLPKAFVCSALRGDVALNQQRRKAFVRELLLGRQVLPISGVAMYADSLELASEEENEYGFYCCVVLMSLCDRLYVYRVNGHVSSGMAWEIDWWTTNRSADTITYFDRPF